MFEEGDAFRGSCVDEVERFDCVKDGRISEVDGVEVERGVGNLF